MRGLRTNTAHSAWRIGIKRLAQALCTLLLILVAIAWLYPVTPLEAIDKPHNHSIPFSDSTLLGQLATEYAKEGEQTAKTGFYPLANGQEALLARLALIDNAQTSIDLQYYIYRDDSTSSLLTYALYLAAERGVRVRVLLDDMQARNDSDMASLAAHPNIELRLFNPFANRSLRALDFINDFKRMNRRMHNKSIIADNAFAIAGGRNIGNEYFAANHEVDFGDFDFLLTGQSVPEISNQFDLYWNSTPAVPSTMLFEQQSQPDASHIKQWKQTLNEHFNGSDYAANIDELPLIKALKDEKLKFYWGEADVHYDQPTKVYKPSNDDFMLNALDGILRQAETSFLLVSPYFVPTQAGTDLLVSAAHSGIDITIITNSLASNDVFAVHGWYAKYRAQLLAAGIKLYEVKADPKIKKKYSWLGSSRTSLHAKTFILDDSKIFAGSFNFDPRSAFLNTEMGVLIEAPQFVTDALANLDKHLAQNTYRLSLTQDNDIVWHNDRTHQEFTSEPDASLLLRLGAWGAGILPIEEQL